MVNLKRVDFDNWWSGIWKGVRSTGLIRNFFPHDVIFTQRQPIVVSFDGCNPFGKNIRSAKFRSVLISAVQICMVATELVLSSIGGIVNKCRPQPSEYGRQSSLNIVHAQSAAQQQSNGSYEGRMSGKCGEWREQFIMNLSPIH